MVQSFLVETLSYFIWQKIIKYANLMTKTNTHHQQHAQIIMLTSAKISAFWWDKGFHIKSLFIYPITMNHFISLSEHARPKQKGL